MLENRLTARTNSNPTENTPFENFSDEFSSIYKRVRDIIGKVPIEDWAGSAVEEKLIQLKDELDDFRRRENGTIIGGGQLEFLVREAQNAVSSNTRWLILGQQQVMGDVYLMDYESAVADAPTAVEKALWKQVIKNLTSGDDEATYCSYQTYPAYSRNEYRKCFPVDNEITELARVSVAAGRYKINWGFDDWHGYTTERTKVLEALSVMRGNVIIHASDLHNEFASVIRTDDGNEMVGAEFTIATTSGGLESSYKFAPMPLNDQALVSGNKNSMRYASTNGKGTAVVTLTKEKAHVDYYYMDEPSKLNYQGVCDVGLEWYHSEELKKTGLRAIENDIVRATCLPGPKSQPYQYMLYNFGIHFTNPELKNIAF